MAKVALETDPLVVSVQSLPLPIALLDVRGIIRSINAALSRLTGYTADHAVGQPATLLSVATAKHCFIDVVQETVQSGAPWRGQWVCRGSNGDPFDAEQTVTPVRGPNGEVLYVLLEIQDLRVTRSAGAEGNPGAAAWSWNSESADPDCSGQCSKLAIQAQRDFELFFDLIPDLACIVSKDGYFKKVNKVWETTLGYTREEVLKTPMLELIHPDDLESTLKEVGKQGPSYRTKHFVNRYRHKNGTYRLFDWTTTFTRDDATRFGVARDITEQRQAEVQAREMARQITHSAEHDFLTGLPNRMLLDERVSHAIDSAERHQKKVALMFLDLDGFKHINDSLGHSTGDKLLQSIAQRLVACVRECDTVSRQGGDEFVVLLSNLDRKEDIAPTANRLLRAVAEPHWVDDRQLYVTTSIGVSIFPDDALDAETLIKNADTAMYQAKENGRESCQFFTTEMNIRALARQSIEESLRRALERQEFVVHYQPRVDLRTGAITGAEALLRWTHPVRGPVSPAQFIPVAEDCGLILPIGRWVLAEACRQARAWADAGGLPLNIAVNVSAAEFRNQNFVENVFAILAETGLNPHLLEIELTESVLMKYAPSTESALKSLRACGVQVSVDDFGTGYSSLSCLRRFPVDALKIDKSFVSQITTAVDETTIVTAVIGMGRSLGLRVIAEGVETHQELAFLQAHNCDEAQGYYFSPSLPPEEFALLLAAGVADVRQAAVDEALLPSAASDWQDRNNLVN